VNSSVKIKNGTSVIELNGAANIDYAAKIRDVFLDAAAQPYPIVLNMEHITDCDCSFVQLLLSVCHTLLKGGRTVELYPESKVPDSVLDAIRVFGFNYRDRCSFNSSNSCLLGTLYTSFHKQQEFHK
jgi:hypothetical protein